MGVWNPLSSFHICHAFDLRMELQYNKPKLLKLSTEDGGHRATPGWTPGKSKGAYSTRYDSFKAINSVVLGPNIEGSNCCDNCTALILGPRTTFCELLPPGCGRASATWPMCRINNWLKYGTARNIPTPNDATRPSTIIPHLLGTGLISAGHRSTFQPISLFKICV